MVDLAAEELANVVGQHTYMKVLVERPNESKNSKLQPLNNGLQSNAV